MSTGPRDPVTLLPTFTPDVLPDILRRLGRPLSRQRHRALYAGLSEELERRADQNGTTIPAELELAAATAVNLARSEAMLLPARSWAEWEVFYRRRVQELVTRDLLGPGWRETPREPLDRVEEDVDVESDLEAVYERLDQLVATPAERDLVDRICRHVVQEGETGRDARRLAAAETGRSPNATRQMLSRLRRRNAS